MDDTSTIARLRHACAEDDQDARAAIETEVDTWQAQRDARLAAPSALADAARWYASHGHPVFPCRPGAKTPATRRGFKDATLDLEQVTAWWQATPQANIGLPTGHAFDVLDVDGPPGYMSLAQLEAEHGPFPHIAYASTPRGGAHLYLPPTGRGNTAGTIPGLDWRGTGGYVIAPPSIVNGRRYVWTQPLGAAA